MEGTAIIIKKGTMKMEFNIKMPTGKGVLFGVKIHRRMDFCGVASPMTSPKLTLLEAHDK
jgi:hypothetical protein